MKALTIATAIAATAATLTFASPAAAEDDLCPALSRVDTGSAGANTYTLCSYDPGFGKMAKDLYLSVSGGPDTLVGSAPHEGITTGFAVPAATTVVYAAANTGADECQVQASFDGGVTWTKTHSSQGGPQDLVFTDADHGSVSCFTTTGVEDFITEDGGLTWQQV